MKTRIKPRRLHRMLLNCKKDRPSFRRNRDADPQSDSSLRLIHDHIGLWREWGGGVVPVVAWQGNAEPPSAELTPLHYSTKRWGTILWKKYGARSAFLEDTLYLPLHFALLQQRLGNFTAALDWFRRVYDSERKPEPPQQGWSNPRL